MNKFLGNCIVDGMQVLADFTIMGQPGRKSNSRRIVTNRATGKPMIIKSAVALDYELAFLAQVPLGARGEFGDLDTDLALFATIFYASRRPDLSVELIKDLLEKAGVIKNDRYIRYECIVGRVDKKNPRADIQILTAPAYE